jgi:dolichol-phosphate mannosyltransferase
MDGDFSHHPRYISDFFMAIKHCDGVIGSRMIFGGRERGRSVACRIITKTANLYIRIIFHTKIKDCTSGFRCFRREVVRVPDDFPMALKRGKGLLLLPSTRIFN